MKRKAEIGVCQSLTFAGHVLSFNYAEYHHDKNKHGVLTRESKQGTCSQVTWRGLVMLSLGHDVVIPRVGQHVRDIHLRLASYKSDSWLPT